MLLTKPRGSLIAILAEIMGAIAFIQANWFLEGQQTSFLLTTGGWSPLFRSVTEASVLASVKLQERHCLLYLLIYGLFNNAVNSWGYSFQCYDDG
jgi:hypothetical protein